MHIHVDTQTHTDKTPDSGSSAQQPAARVVTSDLFQEHNASTRHSWSINPLYAPSTLGVEKQSLGGGEAVG